MRSGLTQWTASTGSCIAANRNTERGIPLCWALFLLSFVALIGCANALEVKPITAGGPAEARADLWFNIAPQPLADALEEYGRRAGVQILYKSHLVEGLRSPGVSGAYSKAGALRHLLDGTGLDAHYMDANNLTLALIETKLTDGGMPSTIPAAMTVALAPIRVEANSYDSFLYDTYAELVQTRIRRRLSSDSKIGAAGHGLRIMIWVNAGGIIQRAAVFSSSGDENIDATVVRSVDGLALSAHPPDGFPQPLHVRISN